MRHMDPVKLSPKQNWCRKPPTETWTISHQAYEAIQQQIGLLEMTIFSIPHEDQKKYYLDGDCSIIQLGSIVLNHTQVSE